MSTLIALAAALIAVLCAAWARRSAARAEAAADAATRHAHYDNRAGVYQHPRSAR